MKGFLEGLFLVGLGIIFIALVVLIISLPFALLGWILLSFVGLFVATAATTYFNCVIAGLGSIVVVSLLGAIVK